MFADRPDTLKRGPTTPPPAAEVPTTDPPLARVSEYEPPEEPAQTRPEFVRRPTPYEGVEPVSSPPPTRGHPETAVLPGSPAPTRAGVLVVGKTTAVPVASDETTEKPTPPSPPTSEAVSAAGRAEQTEEPPEPRGSSDRVGNEPPEEPPGPPAGPSPAEPPEPEKNRDNPDAEPAQPAEAEPPSPESTARLVQGVRESAEQTFAAFTEAKSRFA